MGGTKHTVAWCCRVSNFLSPPQAFSVTSTYSYVPPDRVSHPTGTRLLLRRRMEKIRKPSWSLLSIQMRPGSTDKASAVGLGGSRGRKKFAIGWPLKTSHIDEKYSRMLGSCYGQGTGQHSLEDRKRTSTDTHYDDSPRLRCRNLA